MTRLGPILAATIATAGLDRSTAAYRDGLGLDVIAEGRVPEALAGMWGAPRLTGARWRLLAGSADAVGALRLVEVPAPLPDARPLASLGWAAAELSVADVDRLAERALPHGFRLLGPPRPLGSNPAIRAAQLAGPAGEALYLTDVRAYEGRLDLHRARHTVDRCFVAVLAATDLETARAVYETRFAAARVSDRPVAVPALEASLGVAEAVRISSVQLAGGCLVEVDAYPPATPPRATAAGLPVGVAAMTFRGPVSVGVRLEEPPYLGGMVAVERGAVGELIELVGEAP